MDQKEAACYLIKKACWIFLLVMLATILPTAAPTGLAGAQAVGPGKAGPNYILANEPPVNGATVAGAVYLEGISFPANPGNITVELYNRQGKMIGSPVLADAYGFYQFTGLSAGNYILFFSAPRYLKKEIDFAVADNDTIILEAVTLKAGDANGDNSIDLDDLLMLAKAYGARTGERNYDLNSDFDMDGRNGLSDLIRLSINYKLRGDEPTFEPIDNTPPAEVSNPNVIPGRLNLAITWVDPPDADLDKCKIYLTEGTDAKNVADWGQARLEVKKGVQSATVGGLVYGQPYVIKITTVDTSTNESNGLTMDNDRQGYRPAPGSIPGNSVAAITEPVGMLDVTPVVISGTASDPDGDEITSVAVEVYRHTDGRYLNLSRDGSFIWSAPPAWLPATTSDGYAHWSLDVHAATWFDDTYTVRASVCDGACNENAGSATFTVEAHEPEVDLYISPADLKCKNPTLAYVGVHTEATVHIFREPSAPPVGVLVRFIVNGKTVDEVPCYIDSGDYEVVSSDFYPTPDPYYFVPDGELAPMSIQVVVDSDNRLTETNEGNNVASIIIDVKGLGIEPSEPPDEALVSLSSADLSYGPDEQKNYKPAEPGGTQTLFVTVHNNSDKWFYPKGNFWAKIYVDGDLVYQASYFQIPPHGTDDFFYDYIVPHNRTKPLNFRVELDNGYSGSLTVPVAPRDISIAPCDLGWGYGGPAKPGQSLKLKATVHNNTRLDISTGEELVVRFVIDGKTISEQKTTWSWNQNPTGTITLEATYLVPATQTTPMNFRVEVDPYNLLVEDREDNNSAAVQIPIAAGDNLSPDFSIAASDLTFSPRPLVPGNYVYLMAQVKNNSWQKPDKDLRVLFKIDGNVIYDTSISPISFYPQQYKLLKKGDVPNFVEFR